MRGGQLEELEYTSSDFEDGLVNAIKKIFPAKTHYGD